jgi:tetratricopeptide (TPR) repeat protein
LCRIVKDVDDVPTIQFHPRYAKHADSHRKPHDTHDTERGFRLTGWRIDSNARWFQVAAAIVLVSAAASQAQTDHRPSVQGALEQASRDIQIGEYQSALDQLELVEQSEPDNPWLWFYRGLARLRTGDWYGSMSSLDRAQDLLYSYGNPEPALSDRINLWRNEARQQVFGLRLQIGLAYDSNVTFLGSAGEGLDISGRGDGRFNSRFQFAYAPIADEKHRLTFGARAANTRDFSIEEFDDQDYGATIRYSQRLGDSWETAAQYDYDISYLNRQPFLSNHRIELSATKSWIVPTGRFRPIDTTILYRIHARDFLFPTDPVLDRDGFLNAVGIQQRFLFQPIPGDDWAWQLSTGYVFESVATEGTEFDRLDHRFNIGLSLPFVNPFLPDRALTVRLNAQWEIADYRKDSVIDGDGDERSDFITTIDTVISQELVRDAKWGDLTLHGIVAWSDTNSNVRTSDRNTPFTYDKWVAGVQLEWSW